MWILLSAPNQFFAYHDKPSLFPSHHGAARVDAVHVDGVPNVQCWVTRGDGEVDQSMMLLASIYCGFLIHRKIGFPGHLLFIPEPTIDLRKKGLITLLP